MFPAVATVLGHMATAIDRHTEAKFPFEAEFGHHHL
jgi:hypothetical protein